MASSGGAGGGGETRPPFFVWVSRLRNSRLSGPIAAVAILAAFGTGVATTKGMEAVTLLSGKSNAAQADMGFGWGLFGKPRAANAPRRGTPKPAGFAVWRTRVDTRGAAPAACIEMSRPLDPAKSYGDFVLVAPDPGVKPAVTARGAELCIGGLGFTDRDITLLKGLPGAKGEKLAANAAVHFEFGDKPPYVGFAGGGVILPREEADGVGIETVNVGTLAIEVFRVADRNLVRKSISAPDPTGEDEYSDDYGQDSARDEGISIWKGRLAVRGDPGRRVTTVFPLGAVLKEMKPGAYVVVAKDATGQPAPAKNARGGEEYDPHQPAQARRWIMFTDMALTAYEGSDGLDVVVRSLKSAKTMPGLRVALVARNGEDLAEARSDAAGRVHFARPLLDGDGPGDAKMVMAYGGQGDLAALDLDRAPADLSKQGIGGRNAEPGRTAAGVVDAYLYADRGVYRPGETVHLNALLRDREARAVKDRKGVIVIRRPSGVEFARYRFASTPMGSAGADATIPKSAPRGQWKATVELDGLDTPAGELAFSVEDFAPQRLAVTASGREQVALVKDETRPVEVTARFLYGAVGAGLATQGEARLRIDHDPFPQFEGYQWGDQKEPFEEKFLDLDRTVTDGAGRAILHLSAFAAHDTAQPLEAALVASVFEPGGRPVRENATFKVRPVPLYLGVKVTEGQATRDGEPPVSVDVIAANSAGQRVAANGVQYTLISENWDWDWYQQDSRWNYRREHKDVVITKGVLNVPAGQPARITRRLGWGDYRVELTGPGGAKSVIRFASGWGEPAKDVEAPDVARVTAGTKAYQQGDTIEVTLKAPFAGEAQVAVATDRLIDLKTLSVSEKSAKVKLKSSAAWGGGAYVLVSVIQPRDPVASPKPRRALGVLYVPLDAKARKLDVQIGTPVKAASKKQLEAPIQIRGQGFGGKARVTVAAVDEGILRITKFASPDPVKWYFGKRALSLNLRDDYGRLLDPNLGAPANVNFGADGMGGEELTTTPIRTVALWSGLVETDRLGRATVRLPAPDFNGELRLMVVAWTDEAVGGASKPLTVREPVVADLNLPRFLAPGDKAYASLELHNLEGRPGGYVTDIVAQGGIAAQFRKLFQLPLGQRVVERIPFLAPRRAGVGKVGFRVSGPGFATARDYPIQTRMGWGRVTRTTVALQQPGESFTPQPALLAGLAAGDATLQVSYSPFRGFDPAPIADSLRRYPYGCTEQLVSGAYPLLYATELAKDPKQRRNSAGLNQAVGRLVDRQSLDGSFGLWRVGDGDADAWLGAYATDFLIEARKAGAPVDQGVVDRALSAMRQIARPEGYARVSYRTEYPDWWFLNHDWVQGRTQALRRRASAYALYVMAKGGQGDLARLRWWHDVQMKSEDQPLAKAHVAAGLAMMGDRARARSAFKQTIASIGYRDQFDWYQSPLRDTAAIVALAYEAGEVDLARSLQARLENSVKDVDALNTQEQARLLQAAHFMLRAAGPVRIQAAGAIPLSAAGGGPRWAVGRLADARFANAGAGGIWRTVTVVGAPTAPPAPEASGVTISKQLFDLKGAPANLMGLKQGDRVIVLLRGSSSQARTVPLVVDDALPAGFEIEAALGPGDAEDGPFRFLGKLNAPQAQESRDDRYIASMELPGEKEFAFAYVARAVTPGEFLLPGAEARDMYRPSVNARTAARRTAIAPGS